VSEHPNGAYAPPLLAAVTAALDRHDAAREQAWDQTEADRASEHYTRDRDRIAADRRVLARHSPVRVQTGSKTHGGGPEFGWRCSYCQGRAWLWPCPDATDLAARYAVTASGDLLPPAGSS
jgi:hypothetical protein